MKVQAKSTKAAKFCAVFSQRKAMRLKRLSLPMPARCWRGLCRGAWERTRLCGGVLAVRDGGADAATACRLAVGLGVVAFVAEHGPRRDVGADIEQDLEIAAVAGLAAGQMESQRQAVKIGLQVDLGRKPQLWIRGEGIPKGCRD